MKRISSLFIMLVLSLTGCKTMESMQEDLDSLTSNLAGEKITQDQLNSAFDKAESAFQNALSAYNQIASDSLIEYDSERVTQATKIWIVLEQEFDELRLTPEHALDSASLFSSDTVADEIMEQSQDVIMLVSNAQLSKERITIVLKPIRDQFAVLDKLDANQYYEQRYQQLSKQHDELKELLIDGKEDKVISYIPSLIKDLGLLEQDVVVQYYFAKYFNALRQLANSDKSTVLPSVYEQIKDQTESAEQFARTHARDYSQIEQLASLLDLQLLRVDALYTEYLARETALKNDEVESQLLGFEKELSELTKQAGLGDLRHLSFSAQLQQLKKKL